MNVWIFFSEQLKLLEARFVVEQLEFWCRDTDVPIRVGLFDVLKAGEIMMKQKLETFLSRYRLTGIYCAEKNSPPKIRKANRVRLFKD